MSEYIHTPTAVPQPVAAPPGGRHEAPSLQLPVQASKAKSALRIFAGTVSIAVGFWGGSAAMALNNLSTIFGPRFVWLAVCLGFAALCAVITGFIQIVRHRVRDLRIPALSMAFAAINVLSYVAVYVAFPMVTPMLGGLVLAALAIVLLALSMVFDAPRPPAS